MSTPDKARDRAFFLGALRLLLEGGRRDIGDQRFRIEIDSVNGPSAVTLVEMYLRRRMDSFDREARIRQLKRQRHRETPGMGGAK
jgi:hypothetical protein